MSYFLEAKAHFVASHQHPINQMLHHLTNLLAIAAVVLLFYDWRLTLVAGVLTQVFALGGHAVFEKNQPASPSSIPASPSWCRCCGPSKTGLVCVRLGITLIAKPPNPSL